MKTKTIPARSASYVLGLLEGTLGSVHKYTREELLEKIQLAVSVLKAELFE